MNKLLKYKKIIAFLLVFTLSFSILFNRNEQKAEAFVIADDLLFITLGLMALGTGAVALSKPQISDMGSRIFDKLTLDGIQETIVHRAIDGTIQGIKITSRLKEIINSVVESLPSIDSLVSGNTGNLSNLNLSFTIPKNETSQYTETVLYSGHSLSSGYAYVLSPKGNELVKSVVKPGRFIEVIFRDKGNFKYDFIFHHIDPTGAVVSGGFMQDVSIYVGRTVNIVLDGSYELDYGTVSIPYGNTSIKENYNPTYTDENLKENSYLPLPLDTGVFDNVSTELPLTWDDVKEQVLPIPNDDTTDIPTDVPTDTPTDTPTDDTQGGILDGIKGFFSGLWDLLKSILNAILSAIQAILAFLGGLLTSLAQLLADMVQAISDAIAKLFRPSIALEDVFKVSKGGFNQLKDFFNWDNLWGITPKAYEFVADINMLGMKVWHIELRPFDVSYVKNNLPIFRNVMSYSILMSVAWAIVRHVLPKRNMD